LRRALTSPTPPPMMVTAPYGVLLCGALARLWLTRPRYGLLGFPCDPCGIRRTTVPANFRSRFILPRASAHLQSMTEPARRPPVSGWTAPPMRFPRLFAPSAPQVRSSRRVPTRRRLPPSGFLNLSAVFSLHHLAGLFHPAAHVQAFPFRAFSFQKSRIASRRPFPSCRYRRPPSLAGELSAGSSTGPCSPLEVRCTPASN